MSTRANHHIDDGEDLPHKLEDLLADAPGTTGLEPKLADRLEQLLGDEVRRNATPLRRDVARRARGTGPAISAMTAVQLDAAVVDAVTLAVDAAIERLLPGLVEEAVGRALGHALSVALPLAVADVLPAAIEASLPAAVERVLPDAIDEAITEVIEHMAPASPALERATDALRRLRERTTPRAS